MPSFSNASLARLDTCDIRLQIMCKEAIKQVDFMVLEGHRDEAAQNAAFERGASKLKYPHGKHNAFPSRAVDVAPVYFDFGGKINWKDIPAFARLAGYLERIAHEKGFQVRLGMDWDGDWRTAGHDPGENFLDAPHVELLTP